MSPSSFKAAVLSSKVSWAKRERESSVERRSVVRRRAEVTSEDCATRSSSLVRFLCAWRFCSWERPAKRSAAVPPLGGVEVGEEGSEACCRLAKTSLRSFTFDSSAARLAEIWARRKAARAVLRSSPRRTTWTLRRSRSVPLVLGRALLLCRRPPVGVLVGGMESSMSPRSSSRSSSSCFRPSWMSWASSMRTLLPSSSRG